MSTATEIKELSIGWDEGMLEWSKVMMEQIYNDSPLFRHLRSEPTLDDMVKTATKKIE